MSLKEEISKNLLYYRKKFGYTQKQLAELLGVKNSSVSNWENGQNSIDIETLFKACQIFNVTLNDMYGKYTFKDEYTKHEKALVYYYRKADPITRTNIDKLLNVEDPETIKIRYAARNGNSGEHELTKEEIEKFNELPDMTDI